MNAKSNNTQAMTSSEEGIIARKKDTILQPEDLSRFHPKLSNQRKNIPAPSRNTSELDAAPKNEVCCSDFRPVRCETSG
jgi:hypothetical protein